MRAPYLDDGDVRLYLGDCLDVLAEMEPESVDAVVCDPPYGIGFMGKAWDAKAIQERVEKDNASRKSLGPESPTRAGRKKPRSSSAFGNAAIVAGPVRDHTLTRARSGSMHAGEYDLSLSANQAFAVWCESWARAAFRVLKPGGHLLAFGGTRTFHRLTCGIEDAGFEIRDCLSWLYGSGFPKSLDVSKAIDKAAGAEREVCGPDPHEHLRNKNSASLFGGGSASGAILPTSPATDAAREWEGWGTALKPAWEPCVVARKPLAGTVAANVQAHGTGALNIDGCRIGTDGGGNSCPGGDECKCSGKNAIYGDTKHPTRTNAPIGRWPANVALDEHAAELLDAQSGTSTAGAPRDERGRGGIWTESVDGIPAGPQYGDTGGASRFYFVSKEDTCDRANTADASSHPQSGPGDSAPSDAATSEHRAAMQPTPESSPARSTNGTENECEQRSASDTGQMRSSASGFSPESQHEERIQSRSRASDAGPSGPTGITTTTHGQPISGGSVGSVTSPSTSPSAAPGELDSLPIDEGGTRFHYTAKASRADRSSGGLANNTHPTVKPTDLMRWLVRLVTPPGGLVLDPFAGSGTTLVAARAEGFRAIGIEREEEYAAIIADRLSQLSLFSEAL